MIRKATLDDLDLIYSLYKSYSLDISRIDDPEYATYVQMNGFLIDLENKQRFEERIKNNLLFNVFYQSREILGFVVVNKEIYFPKEADNIIWFDKRLKDAYFHSDKSTVLHEIIVDRYHTRKGIGSQLLEFSIKKLGGLGYTDLFSIVATGPLTDCPSILFHTKSKFKRACVTKPIDLFGLKNYESLLFHRDIT